MRKYHMNTVKAAVSAMSYCEGFDFAERHRLEEGSLRHPDRVSRGTFSKLVRALLREGHLAPAGRCPDCAELLGDYHGETRCGAA